MGILFQFAGKQAVSILALQRENSSFIPDFQWQRHGKISANLKSWRNFYFCTLFRRKSSLLLALWQLFEMV